MTNYITKTIKNGVEANIPVTSVNGQYGDVTIQTGGNYTAGNGIDITNDEIGLDGTYSNYSAIQGPCPDGFHVPLSSEWQAVINIWTALGGGSSDGTNFGKVLKLPFAGNRRCTDGEIFNVGTHGYYWTCSPDLTYTYDAIRLYFTSTFISSSGSEQRAMGFSIRPFKDIPVIPDNTWITLYSGTGTSGIFYNSSLGLISLSSDGNNWTTITDKNLGATQVWNNGDTLSDDNCGYFYQWGNNYSFPHSGSITTSSTKVNASDYGPGNYYSSSTFITTTSSSGRDWSSVRNDNLWGGVTGVASGNLVINDNAGPKSIIKVRGGTQAQYEALTTKDPNTLYFTTES